MFGFGRALVLQAGDFFALPALDLMFVRRCGKGPSPFFDVRGNFDMALSQTFDVYSVMVEQSFPDDWVLFAQLLLPFSSVEKEIPCSSLTGSLVIHRPASLIPATLTSGKSGFPVCCEVRLPTRGGALVSFFFP